MLEKSDLADNAVECLHNEQYDRPYNLQNLNYRNLLFSGGRERESLGGEWRFTLDLHDTGLRQKWFLLQQRDAETRRDPYDYDPFAGQTIPVPSCWQMIKDKWFYFEGSAWYTREIDYIERDEDERVFLRVGAANYDCKVFLNHRFIGNHYGGSTPFCAELTPQLQPGNNILMLCVNNNRTTDRLPLRNNDWFNYGGIYREIDLIRTPASYIRDLFVYLVPDGGYNRIAVRIAVEGPATEVNFTLTELGISQSLPVVEGVAEATFCVQPVLWSPEQPKLYQVMASLGRDWVSDRVGFRQIEVVGTDIRLNGRSLYLRGVNCHEDDLLLGKMASEADIRRRFRDAKALNCNYLRLAHYPHHEMAARIADEVGLLLWEEIPNYWAIDFNNPATQRDAHNQLMELIMRDRNRASVIIWSVGNENADTDERLHFMTTLVKAARQADPSRLISAACLVNHAKMKIEDRLADHLDIIGLNEYYGWYEENFEDLIALGENSSPTKPVVITETGAEGVLGEHAPQSGPFSEHYMAEVYRKQTAYLPKLGYVRGFTPWLLYDYRSERRQNPYQQGFNCKGLIAADKHTRKAAFYILRDFYQQLKQAESLSD
ncbi:glycoside hydrolase family 2 protein [Serratia oryzae]|uniref:Beta-glucuronidase n=1 Tax=Serratia oryzae TaxID=2034155 RepID=A0A1S8CK56_9GAMM|nr:glycoside hydrolase family 2 [Serratia oryzae]OMQ23026.1 glycosyl hydrolase family 2 [Serratia oryzae]VXC66186.1 Glycosyl hydrolase family 2 [Enterobacterales bacterium 8AC]